MLEFLEEDDCSNALSTIETLKQIASISSRSGSIGSALLTWQSARISADQVPASISKLTELFPGEAISSVGNKVAELCPQACQKLRFHFSDRLAWKISNLHDAYAHPRLPVLLYGPRLSGKSSLLQILVECLRLAQPQKNFALEKICLGAYTEEALMSDASHSIIPQLIRHCSTGDKDVLMALYGPWMHGVHDILLEALCDEGDFHSINVLHF